MENMILILHVIVCVALIVLVLLQSGKEGMGVIFGGGSSSLFGSTGAGGILVKLTAFMAVVFVATSLTYNIVSSSSHAEKQESSIVDIVKDTPASPKNVPAQPQGAPAATSTQSAAPAQPVPPTPAASAPATPAPAPAAQPASSGK